MEVGARLHSCDTLSGASVADARGGVLGCVDELVLDVLSGRVEFVILFCGGFSGADRRRVVVPWRWLRYEPRTQTFRLTEDRQAVAAAPELAEDTWPDFSDERLQRRLTQHYEPFGGSTPELPSTGQRIHH